jgi:hypothetical protein
VTTSGVGAFPDGTQLHEVLQTVATSGLSVVLDGWAVPIKTGSRGWVEVPFPGQITRVKMLADQVCNVVVDIWKTTYDNYPPVAGDSICGSAKPRITSASGVPKSEMGLPGSPMTGWTSTISGGDILWFHVDSNDVASMLTISLTIAKS